MSGQVALQQQPMGGQTQQQLVAAANNQILQQQQQSTGVQQQVGRQQYPASTLHLPPLDSVPGRSIFK